MSRNNIKYDPAPGNAVDNYFKAARSVKVEFTKDKAEALLAGHIAAGVGATGFLFFLKKLLAPGPMSLLFLSSALVLLTMFYPGSEKGPGNNPGTPKTRSIIPLAAGDSLPETPENAVTEARPNVLESGSTKHIDQLTTIVHPKRNDRIIDERRSELYAALDDNQGEGFSDVPGYEFTAISVSDLFDKGDHQLNKSASQPEIIELTDYQFSEFETDEPGFKTLFSHYVKHSSFAADGSFKMTQFNGDNTMLVGGRLLYIMNKNMGIGLAGYGVVSNPQSNSWNGPLPQGFENLLMGYGGFYLEYINSSDELLHWSVGSLFGFGGYGVRTVGSGSVSTHTTAFGVVEPGAGIIINFSDNFRLGAELSYRFTKNMFGNEAFKNDPLTRSTDFDGPAIGLFIKAGIF